MACGKFPGGVWERDANSVKVNVGNWGVSLAKRKHDRARPAAASEPEHDQSQKSNGFLIVGVGASAGGFEAFQQVLREIPKDAGIAIVLVQHMAPQHESALGTLLSASTELPVVQIAEDTRVEPNHVYVI